jgi:DNA repair protein RecO
MAYHVYSTKGVILGSFASREADRVYSILTEELGLVRARARSVRAIQSKLRGALEPFSLSVVSLVRGKDSWRITGATLIDRLSEEKLGKPGLVAFGRIFSLIDKLVAGEEAHKELLMVIEEGLQYVYSHKNEAKAETLEILLVLRLLHELGYVSGYEVDKRFLEEIYSSELLAAAHADRKKLIDVINQGIHSSDLL